MKSNQERIIDNAMEFVRKTLEGAEGGHDWWHVSRVLEMTRIIAREEKADLFICELIALLHDIDDPKFLKGKQDKADRATCFLMEQGLDPLIISRITEAVKKVSYAESLDKPGNGSLEAFIVQDADRLDALGAIGIARAFNYGGFRNRRIYDPGIPARTFASSEEYRNSETPTINHF